MNINIPQKLKVGFKSRGESLDGNLSFVTYLNEKGEVAQEKSWNSWRDKNIDALDINNIPTNGYFFDKSIKRMGSFSSANSYLRVYDSRGFEFEIKIENVSLILQTCTIDKGEIKEKCILGWDGRTLYLLPETSQEYQTAMLENSDSNKNINEENLILGNIYKSSRGNFVYVGKMYFMNDNQDVKTKLTNVFYRENSYYDQKNEINLGSFCTPALSSLKNTEKQYINYERLIKYIKKRSVKRTGIKIISYDKKNIDRKAYIKIKDTNHKEVFCNIAGAYHLYLDYKAGKRKDPITEYDFKIIKLTGSKLDRLGFQEEKYVSRINLTILMSNLHKIEEQENKEESLRDFSFLSKIMIKEEDKLIEF